MLTMQTSALNAGHRSRPLLLSGDIIEDIGIMKMIIITEALDWERLYLEALYCWLA